MHLIFATSIVPDGTPKSGYEIANAAVLDALTRAGCRMSVMGFAWKGREERQIADGTVVLGELDPRTEAADGLTKLGWLARSMMRGMTFSSAKMLLASPGEVRRALEGLGRVDGVVFNSVQFAGAFRRVFADLPCIYVAHNVEHLSALQSADAARGLVGRFMFRREARLLKALEAELCAQARFVYTLSEDDRRLLGVADDRRSAVLPLVAHEPAGSGPGERQTTHDAALIGTWSWAPNRIGLDWFLEEVVPHLPEGFRIAVAGDAPADLAQRHGRVTFVGRVPDAVEFVRSGRVVPLISRAGTGVQLKTIETFELGLPSVATQSALRGISHKPENCIVADDPRAFAEALVRAAKNPVDLDGRAFHMAQRKALDTAILHGLDQAGFNRRDKAA
ncbi:glycosyltransferase family 4 protein [Nitratireductor rhodophyticola]|uniref:glycosyltransferase n=1 Tax=Nitratireductor rhodophyticola TaxID=2854036 RepID=UPI002AC995D7|nr:glycosyltransferase family 4 protein [Nitratireductor rhodophyticola]WPZ14661.1 glycosyltransferase family 4 protein [Nitratireductor rhodophyticola]